MRFESQLSRMNCQIVSTGLSSSDFGGSGKSVMLAGTGSFAETCHPGLIEDEDVLCSKNHGRGASV